MLHTPELSCGLRTPTVPVLSYHIRYGGYSGNTAAVYQYFLLRPKYPGNVWGDLWHTYHTYFLIQYTGTFTRAPGTDST